MSQEQQAQICPNGHPLDPDAQYCTTCGASRTVGGRPLRSHRSATMASVVVLLLISGAVLAFVLTRRSGSHTTVTEVIPTTTTAPAFTTTTTSATTTSGPANRAILAPASVAPLVDECTQQLQFGVDGTAGPLTCSTGELNTLAWQYYAAFKLGVMSLGPYATPSGVFQTLCSDAVHSSGPIAADAYSLAATYYGWSFAINPTQGLIEGRCPG